MVVRDFLLNQPLLNHCFCTNVKSIIVRQLASPFVRDKQRERGGKFPFYVFLGFWPFHKKRLLKGSFPIFVFR